MLFRQIERELLPLCEAEGLGVIPYNPLAGGFLSGKHRREAGPTAGTRFTLGTAAGRSRSARAPSLRCAPATAPPARRDSSSSRRSAPCPAAPRRRRRAGSRPSASRDRDDGPGRDR
ncbi:MAG: hypothetical protein DMD77_07255, partial [Candidatus Rokuibacteriota bacterium]